MVKRSIIIVAVAVILLSMNADPAFAKRGGKAIDPSDYTKEFSADSMMKPWQLGAIGVKGQFPKKQPRQILISKVAKDSPADGKLLQEDVILGINAIPDSMGCKHGKFTKDAHRVLQLAIEHAEKRTTPNIISLKVWRPKTKVVRVKERPRFSRSPIVDKWIRLKPLQGKVIDVTLEIEPLGEFSQTSPWQCKKTETLIDLMAEKISRRGFKINTRSGERIDHSIHRVVDALGLLATGEDKYLPEIKTYAHSFKSMASLDIAKRFEKGSPKLGSWAGGFQLIFLSEYYLRTKDKAVLPAIKAAAIYLAKGVSGVGTWSHGLAWVHVNGMYGPPSAYGAMNQATGLCAMALALSQKCGVTDPYVDKAVQLSLGYFRTFLDKGCLPYGDHSPVLKHDANGRMSIAALFCNMAGDEQLTNYYARMAIASHTHREGGHATDIFSWQWGGLAAALGGRETAAAFMKSTRYFLELARHHDGAAQYQPMRSKDNMKTGAWSTTGSYLMQYCLPRQAIYCTGKGGSTIKPITGDDLATLLSLNTFNAKGKREAALFKALGSFSVVVRDKAAAELGLKEKDASSKATGLVSQLLDMLTSSNRFARYGALQALRYCGGKSPEVFEALVRIAESDRDWTARYFALKAFDKNGFNKYAGERTLGGLPANLAPRVLKVAMLADPKNDPRRKLPDLAASALFHNLGPYKEERIQKADLKLLIPALSSLLQNPNGGTRTMASQALTYLSEAQMEDLWGVLYDAMTKPAPSGVMSSGGLNANGNKVMAKYHIKEGLPLAVWWVFEKDGWGDHSRKKSLRHIAPYGALINPHIQKWKDKNANYLKWRDVQRGIKEIEKTPAPKLRSIEELIEEFKVFKKNPVLDH